MNNNLNKAALLPYDVLIEIFESVADQLYRLNSGEVGGGLEEWRRTDESRLERTALVCQNWRKPAQDILFRRIFISGIGEPKVYKLLRTSQEQPSLMNETRCLHLGANVNNLDETTSCSGELIRILASCVNVRRLEVDSFHPNCGIELLEALNLPRSQIKFFSSGFPPVVHPQDLLSLKSFASIESCYWLLSNSISSTNKSTLYLPYLTTFALWYLGIPLPTFSLNVPFLENLDFSLSTPSITFDHFFQDFTGNLRRLRINTSTSLLIAFMKNLKLNLSQLEVLSFQSNTNAGITSILPHLPSSLKHLEINLTRDYVPIIISQLPSSIVSLHIVTQKILLVNAVVEEKISRDLLEKRKIEFSVSSQFLSLDKLFLLCQ